MTLNPSITTSLPDAESLDAPDRASRSFAQQAVVDTVRRTGARFGLTWIGLLLLAAVFAPFIASSFPLLVRENGHLHSPLLLHLTPSDVVWLGAFVTGVTFALFRRTTFPQSAAI